MYYKCYNQITATVYEQLFSCELSFVAGCKCYFSDPM